MAISPTGNDIILGQTNGSVTVLHCKKDQMVQGYSMDIGVRLEDINKDIFDLERHNTKTRCSVEHRTCALMVLAK